MSPTASLIVKDTRAVLPAAAAAAIAATLASLGDGTAEALSAFAFVAATLTVGAYAIGHEYSQRTLDAMLTLPVSRARQFFAKMGVATAFVLPLAAYGASLRLLGDESGFPWLVGGMALCFAPLMTMLTRSPLAGTIFGGSFPGLLLNVLIVANGAWWTTATPEIERATFEGTRTLTIALLPVGFALGWWKFMRLESADGPLTEIRLWRRSSGLRRAEPQAPFWQLVKKELRLQQLTFAISAFFLATAVLHAITGGSRSTVDPSVLAALTAIYWLALPVLIGSLTSAEERQLGTLPWQLALPVPAWQQWAAKTGTAFTLALLLGTGLPILLGRLWWPDQVPNAGVTLVLASLMTAGSMYVSSLCATGVRAAVVSFATLPIAVWLVISASQWLKPSRAEFWIGNEGAWFALAAVVVLLLLAFAFLNHRVEHRGTARVWRQVLSVTALVTLAVIAISFPR